MTEDSGPVSGWFVAAGDKRNGPFAEDQVRALITSGRADGRTLAWRQGMPDWMPLSAQAQFQNEVAPPVPPPVPVSDRARSAYVASAVIWGIQLAMGLFWTVSAADEMTNMGMGIDAAAGFQTAMLVFLGISGLVYVFYLMKNNSARVLGIVGSVLSILRAVAEIKKTGSDDILFFAIGILLNVAFIWLAVLAKGALTHRS